MTVQATEPSTRLAPSFVEPGVAQAPASNAPAPRDSHSGSDSVSHHGSTQQAAPNNSPTENAREAATRKHADFVQMLDERLMSNPEYVKLKTLSGAIETALAAPGLRQTMEAQGVELKFTPAGEFGKMVGQEFATWGQVVETAKVKLD